MSRFTCPDGHPILGVALRIRGVDGAVPVRMADGRITARRSGQITVLPDSAVDLTLPEPGGRRSMVWTCATGMEYTDGDLVETGGQEMKR